MRISRVNRSRVSDILVSRQTVVSSVNSVEKSAPSFEIQNSTFNFSDNFWLSKEQFYDHLEKMHSESEHYSEFSLKQDEYKSSKEMANSPKDEILSFVNTVLGKYNQLIDHIAKVDLANNPKNREIQVNYEGAVANFNYAKNYQGLKTYMLEINLVDIANNLFISFPGEIFSELTNQLKAKYNVNIIGYTNDYCLYLTDSNAYDKMYYEALISPFEKKQGEYFIDKCVKIISEYKRPTIKSQ